MQSHIKLHNLYISVNAIVAIKHNCSKLCAECDISLYSASLLSDSYPSNTSAIVCMY